MNQTKKNILFVSICLIMTIGALSFRYYSDYVKKHYGELYLEFIEIAESYEVGSNLEAISFIKETNAENVEYPTIDTSEPGEKNYFYIISDKVGNTREFALTLNITDPIFPIIELREKEVQVEEGSVIDFASFVIRAYDPVEGELPYEIEKQNDYEAVGIHEIKYVCIDKNGNQTESVLTLTVNKKTNEEIPNLPSKVPSNTQNGIQENTQESSQPNNPKPSDKLYMFSDGFNMQTAPQVCNEDLLKAQNANYGATCIQVNGDDGWPIGMQLVIK